MMKLNLSRFVSSTRPVAAAALALALVVGCSEEEEGPAAESCQARDENMTAARAAYANEIATTLDLASCQGNAPSGDTCVFRGQAKDFKDDTFLTQLAGTKVKVFLDNVVEDPSIACTDCGTFSGTMATTGACAADADLTGVVCLEGRVDSTGRIDLPVLCEQPFAVWAYREPSGGVPITKAAIEFDRVVRPTSDILDILTISISTYNIIPSIVGFSPDPQLGIVAGSVQDCGNNDIANITTFVDSGHLDAPSNERFCGDAPIYRVGTFYFADGTPTKDQTATNVDGVWAFSNVPVGAVTVFAYGRTSDGGASTLLGSTKLVSVADTITIADLRITQ